MNTKAWILVGLAVLVVLGGVLVCMLGVFSLTRSGPVTISYAEITVSQVVALAREGRIKEIRLEGEERFTVILDDGSRKAGGTTRDQPLRDVLRQLGVANADELFVDPS